MKDSRVYLQSISNEVCVYDVDTLQLIERLPSPGNIYCLTDDGDVVVGNQGSPSAVISGIQLSVSPLTDLHNHKLQLAFPLGQPYTIGDFLWVTRSNEGNVAVTSFGKTIVDLYDKSGK